MPENHNSEKSVLSDLEPDVLETVRIRCPKCGADIRESAENRHRIVCFCCGRHISVNDRKGDPGVLHETLMMPRGSVRALVTLLMAGLVWLLTAAGREVPGHLLGLILTVTGYYFAFRKKSQGGPARDPFRDITESGRERPLHLPAGAIRAVLVCGFILCGIAAYRRGLMSDPEHLEFFVILAGLAAGYFFAKFTGGASSVKLSNCICHAKGALVLAASAAAVLFAFVPPPAPQLPLLLSCFISFYFGSKS